MYRLIIFMLCLFFIDENSFAQDQILAGQAKSASCVACHGADGNSAANPVWPKLAEQHAKYLYKQLLDFKLASKDGRNNPIMAGITAGLSETDMQELAEYYESLTRTIDASDPALLEAGQNLYRGGNLQKGIPACMACHSPDGLGNGPAAFPLLSGQHAAYIADQLKAFRSGNRSNDLNHMMRDIAAKMSDQEIAAVASYIAGLH